MQSAKAHTSLELNTKAVCIYEHLFAQTPAWLAHLTGPARLAWRQPVKKYTQKKKQNPCCRCGWHLDGNAPAKRLDEGAVVVVAAKGLPELQAHVDALLGAGVLVGNDSLLGDAVVSHGDDLAAELVVLVGRAVLVKVAAGERNERHVGVDVLEVRADAAGTRVAERRAALLVVAKHEDGAGRVLASDGGSAGLHLDRGGRRGSQGQSGGDEGSGELHVEIE